MPLRIANNIASMNTQRWLGVADAGMKKSLERLSSGYRINKAADDAAGLAISQAFRADIASYKVASRNASEASSLLQVAEGAMDQIGNMLTRLKELATQSASGNTSASNRSKIDAEANKLLDEINRIVASTNYGGDTLINGDLGGSQTIASSGSLNTSNHQDTLLSANGMYFGFSSSTPATLTLAAGTVDDMLVNLTDAENVWTITRDAATTVTLTGGGGSDITFAGTIAAGVLTVAGMGDAATDLTFTMAGATTAVGIDNATITLDQTGLDDGLDGSGGITTDGTATAGTYSITESGGNIIITNDSTGKNQSVTGAASSTLDFSELGITLTVGAQWDADDLDGLDLVVTGAAGGSATFQIGAENTVNDRVTISIASVATTSLSTGLTSGFVDSASKAQQALTDIDAAISTLATERGSIGANMNRLSYAAANLASTIENVQAAESVIRDVDMAAEMTEFTKNQILLQAGTAMLAQANMAPQQVLSLFG